MKLQHHYSSRARAALATISALVPGLIAIGSEPTFLVGAAWAATSPAASAAPAPAVPATPAAAASAAAAIAGEAAPSGTVAPAPAATPTPLPLTTLPGAPEGLSLERSILIALHQHGDIGAAEQSFVSAREGIVSAKSGYYPDVTANLDYNFERNHSSSFNNNNNNNNNNNFGNNSFSSSNSGTSTNVNIAQNIFDAGRTHAQVRGAQARALGAVGGVGSARSSIAFTVAQSFYEQLRQTQLVAQRLGQVDLANQQLQQIQAQVEAGTSARSDVQTVQVTLSQARLDLSTSRNDLRIATTNFRSALGLGRGPALKLQPSAEVLSLAPRPTTPANLSSATAAPQGTTPEGTAPEGTTLEAPAAMAPTTEGIAAAAPGAQTPLPFPVATPLPLPVVPNLASLGSYVAEARRLRPDLVQARASVAAGESALSLAKIAQRPQITANAAYNIDPRRGSDRGFLFGAGISVPIFDGGGRKADVRAGEADLSANKIRLAQLEKDADADVEATFVDIAGQVDAVANARELVQAARINLANAVEKYRAGVGIILDIVNAQTQLFTAQTSATQTVYDYEVAKANLDRAIGRFAWADPNQAPPMAAPRTLQIAAKK